MVDEGFSIDDLRARFAAERPDISTDIETLVGLTATPDGMVLRFASVPVTVAVLEPADLGTAAASIGVAVADLPWFLALVTLVVAGGEDGAGGHADTRVLVSIPEGGDPVHGFAARDDGGAWTLDEVARIFDIDPGAPVWDAAEG